MPISQNLAFTGVVADDYEYPNPPGRSVVRLLSAALQNVGWSVSECENWRDCGWSFECSQSDAIQLVTLAQTDEGKWMLQISPLRVPGFMTGLFGAKPSARPNDVLALAQAVHAILSDQESIHDLRWRWDGYLSSEYAGPPQSVRCK